MKLPVIKKKNEITRRRLTVLKSPDILECLYQEKTDSRGSAKYSYVRAWACHARKINIRDLTVQAINWQLR